MRIRADKFYPPQVNTSQFLYRERLVETLLRRCGSRKPTMVVEAQAGQGKTTLIKQFLDHSDCPFVWYQVRPEDADPAFLFAAFQACLAGMPQASQSGVGERELPAGEFGSIDLPKYVDPVLNDLKACLKHDLYIVFDDLHVLVQHPASLLLLNYLVENAPQRLHCVLSSREPLPLDVWKEPAFRRDLLWVGNEDLALTQDEIAEFFHQVFDMSLSHDDVRTLAAKTDGWIMGLTMSGLRMTQGREGAPSRGRRGGEGASVLEYFRRQIFDPLEPRLHEPMLRLSLLEAIPVVLARTVTGESGIGHDLAGLVARNVFIRSLDPDDAVYGLHHLFRQFLREKAYAELSPETVREVYQQAGRHYAQTGNTGQALRYLLQAGDYEAMETLMRRHGTAMLSARQGVTLAAVLGDIPEEELARRGWCAFYLAMAHLDFAPARALTPLYSALGTFRSRDDAYGELCCLALIISVHITTTGLYREGERMLAEAERLFFGMADALDPATTIMLASSFAMGHCIFLADTETATRYASLALKLAGNTQMVSLRAGLLMIMSYIEIFAGNLSQTRAWLEQASAALCPEVSTFNNLVIRMVLFNYLFHDGDFENYDDQKKQLFAVLGHTLVSQSIAGPFCYVWDMDIAINRGRFEAALALARQALALTPALSPHVQSLVLQLQAIALALTGRFEQAQAAADQAVSLREQAGGAYFISLNRMLVGLSRGLCGQLDDGLALLTEGVEAARRMPTDYLEACGLFHRAFVHLERSDPAAAGQDLGKCLGLMRRNRYRHIWAWSAGAIERLLGFAVARRIEPQYAQVLAAKHLDAVLLGDGTAIPLLEFRTLGGFSILLRGVPILEAESLTPAQREFLCLILASPGLKIAQEIAQMHFWADSPPAAVRIALDTMLSRLRKTLAGALPENAAHLYLRRERGILWLEHCRVDALEFQAAVRTGLEHARLQEYWQAGNAFSRAAKLWRGEFAPGTTGEDLVRTFRDGLVQDLVRLALAWCEQLALNDKLEAALDLAEKALASAPLNDGLWALLYRLQGRRSAILARQTLGRFAKRLQADGYPEEEIAELLASIAGAPAPPRRVVRRKP
ncbi:BTAD domain-containing putative transcriptional regulator [Solidesulfovibrio sp.]|uniref:BTAD domain-containing putative transcriptional regulator n=1 Tax=Solidesulfovibrio sp. TaxID=2910990 RepID=UPI00263A15D2|nr:BTAD domain-containing putative transcriptional regulator [Solidesulfovibrio sp.]